jgi:hypothetical protein
MADIEQKRELPLYAIPAVGTCLTVLSALSMLVVCMLLPMVGAAGSATPFARQNRDIFALYVLLSLLLSVAAIVSKMARRAVDGSPRPISSFALCALNVAILLALFSGLLSI